MTIAEALQITLDAARQQIRTNRLSGRIDDLANMQQTATDIVERLFVQPTGEKDNGRSTS